jgi:hypothetical protein
MNTIGVPVIEMKALCEEHEVKLPIDELGSGSLYIRTRSVLTALAIGQLFSLKVIPELHIVEIRCNKYESVSLH